MSAGGADRTELHGRVLREMVDSLPEAERPAALRRMLEELERVHRESGVETPDWVLRLRAELEG